MVFSSREGLCKLLGRHPIERLVRSESVVGITPIGEHTSDFKDGPKVILIEALVAKPAVEAFDERILYRLAGRDMMQAHMAIVGPSHHREAAHLGPVVQNDRLGVTADVSDGIERTRRALSREAKIGFKNKILARAIVANPKDAKAAAVS